MVSPSNTAKILKMPDPKASRRIGNVKRVRTVVEKKLFSLMDGLAFNVAEALFEEMSHLDEKSALECHFNIMRAFKTEGERLQDAMRHQMNFSWLALIQGKDEQPIPDAPYDVTSVLKAYSDKNMNHYKILLEEVRMHFSEIAGADLSFHPLLPGNFFLSFWHATEALSVSYQERKLVLPLFNRFVMDRFGQIVGLGNQVLSEMEPSEDTSDS